MDETGIRETQRDQDGVISRRQLLEHGATPADLRRLLRRRELVPVHPGVYVDHTGRPSAEQRAQAAVQAHWPSALTGRWALPRPATAGPVHVAIAAHRTVAPVPGVVATRMTSFDERVAWLRSPPRVHLEHVALQLADEAPDEAAAFTMLADACQSRQTSPDALAATLATRRFTQGRLLRALVEDLSTGSCSVLERGYATRVVAPHGLPLGEPQARASTHGRRAYRDLELAALGVAVELDGKAFHDTAAARDADHERDLAAAADSALLTLRLTYGQVFRTPCRTASQVHVVLTRRGWAQPLTRCDHCP